MAGAARIMKPSNRPATPARPPRLWPSLLPWGAACAGWLCASAVVFRRRPEGWRRLLFAGALGGLGLSVGLLGLLTWLLAFATNHQVAVGNQNVLLATPAHFAYCLVALGVWRRRPWWCPLLRVTGVTLGGAATMALVLKVLPVALQDNIDSIALLGPPNLALAFLGWHGGWLLRKGANGGAAGCARTDSLGQST